VTNPKAVVKDPIPFSRPHLRNIQPYTPGVQPVEEGWIKLNTNELPYSPPSSVAEAIYQETGRLTLYPNPTSQPLRVAIARHYDLADNQVIIGNGSDDILNLLTRAFGSEKQVVAETFPSYSLYKVLVGASNGELKPITFDTSFALPVEELAATRPNILFLTSPNAPTGVAFTNEVLARLLERMDCPVVVDEAYAEFSKQTAIDLLGQFENLFVTRTFSKAYGLAGLRVGYGLGAPSVIKLLDGVRDSYNVNRLSQAGALAAIREQAYYRSVIAKVIATRDRVREALLARGWEVYPSETNFLFAAPPAIHNHTGPMASQLFAHLESMRILVRYFGRHPLTERFLRISVGTDDQMDRLLEEIDSWTSRQTEA